MAILAQFDGLLTRLSEIPPLHPILVNFTAALVPTSFASDVIGRLLKRESLRTAAWWMMLYAAIATPLTAAAGWYWLWDLGDMDHAEMRVHQWLGTGLTLALLPLATWRYWIYRNSQWPRISYLITAGLVVLLLVVQGHLGGVMSFGAGEAFPLGPVSPDGHTHGHAGSGDASAGGVATDGGHAGPGDAPAGLQWRDAIDVSEQSIGHGAH